MSIPTRIKVYLQDGSVYDNVSWFTLSYHSDPTNRTIWLNRLKGCWKNREFQRSHFKHPPYIDEVSKIEIPEQGFVFLREEISK